jgi:hypothetical protein
MDINERQSQTKRSVITQRINNFNRDDSLFQKEKDKSLDTTLEQSTLGTAPHNSIFTAGMQRTSDKQNGTFPSRDSDRYQMFSGRSSGG